MATADSHAPPSRWLDGPVTDGVLGTGVLFLPVTAMIFLAPDFVRSTAHLVPFLVLIATTPHLGATLVRVYDRAESRRAYRLFAVHATLVLLSLFVLALYVPWVGSALITLYLSVVTWHFTGQNYGIALVFLRRSGVPISAGLKRALYLSFLLPWVIWTVALHSSPTGDSAFGSIGTAGTIYEFLSLEIPQHVSQRVLELLSVVYGVALLSVSYAAFQVAALRTLLPAIILIITQFLWYGAPVIAPGLSAPSDSVYNVMWIQIIHSIQYLWITTFYARREDPETGSVAFIVKSTLAASIIFGFPLMLMAPRYFGPIPYDAGLSLVFVSALNLHHVMIDSVIWKLRHSRIASILIDDSPIPVSDEPTSARPWLRRFVWASGAVGLLFTIVHQAELEGVRAAWAREDEERLAVAVRRLDWMGRESYEVHSQLGFLYAKRGRNDDAFLELERSLTLHPTLEVWRNIGVLHERTGRLAAALAAYEASAAIGDNSVAASIERVEEKLWREEGGR